MMVQLIDRRTLTGYGQKPPSPINDCELFANGVVFVNGTRKRYVPFSVLEAIEFDVSDSTMKLHCNNDFGWVRSTEETFRRLVEAYDNYLSGCRPVARSAMKAE